MTPSAAYMERIFNQLPFQSHSIHGMYEEGPKPHQEMGQLTLEEKRYLLAVERGDFACVRRSEICIDF